MLPVLLKTTSRSARATTLRTSKAALERSTASAPRLSASSLQKAQSVALKYKYQTQPQWRAYHKSRSVWAAEETEAQQGAKNTQEEQAKEGVNGPLSAEEAKALREELDTTKKALEEMTKALAEQKDRLARSYADSENLLRISKRDIANAKEFGIRGFAMKMFDVLDTIELCLSNLPREGVEANSHLESAIITLEATKKHFAKIMSEYEVAPMETKVGDKFDANLHNAVFEMQPTHPDHQPNTVGVIIKNGWTRQGALLRPTHVGVIMKSL